MTCVEVVVLVDDDLDRLLGLLDAVRADLAGPGRSCRVTVVRSGGDEDWERTCRSAQRLPATDVVRAAPGRRGAALRAVARDSSAEVLACLSDAATTPDVLLRMLAPVVAGRAELAVGGWPGAGEPAVGEPAAEPEGGVWAARTAAIRPLLDVSRSTGPALGAELVALAAREGLRTVRVSGRAPAGPVAAGRRTGPPRPATTLLRFGRFGAVGLIGGLVYVLLYLAMRSVVPPAAANLVALVLGSVANAELNRRWTFVDRRVGAVGAQLRSGAVFALHYLVMTGAVTIAVHLHLPLGRISELAVMLASSAVLSVLRFVGLDRWVFRPGR